MAEAAGSADPRKFDQLYWEHRVAYDRGDLTPEEYWDRVAPTGDLTAMKKLDVAIWMHPHQPSLDAAHRAAERGWQLALLSNAPEGVAAGIEAQDWMQFVGHRFYSCRIGEVKPDRRPYEHVLGALGADPGDVVFMDDRAANVEAALALGMKAEVYRGPDQIDRL